MSTKTITYGELKNGDVVYLVGNPFEATNVRVVVEAGRERVYFDGVATPGSDLAHTPYSGAAYAGYADRFCTIRVAR